VALAATHGRPYLLAIGICAVVGLANPPISAVARGLWPRILDPDSAQAIYGLEATAQELVYVAGPALVALVAGVAGAAVAVVTTGLAGLAGTLAYVSSPAFADVERVRRPARQRVLRGTGLARYVLVGGCLTTAFGMVDVGVVAFVGGRHAAAGAGAGVVLAVWSAGSLLGGLRFGTSSAAVTDRRLAGWSAALAGSLALAAVSPDPVVLAVLLLLSGGAIAPSLARLYTRVGSVSPEGATTEAFGWLAVGFTAGYAAGSALGGVSVDTVGAHVVFVGAGAVVAIGAAIALGGRPAGAR
jgi:predicted MFS family arabinose efflux permease